MVHTVSCEIGGKTLTIETGKLAKQANGSVLVSYGNTRILATACASAEPKEGLNFFPLTVEVQERYYANGKIPGGFLKREGRPSNDAVLNCRMIDRPMRPLFPEGYKNDTQLVATVLSVDENIDTEIASAIGIAAATHISDIPFNGPTASCKVGRINGEFVTNPSREQLEESDMDITIAGTRNAIMMVEGGAHEVPEAEVLSAILHGHDELKKVIEIIDELRNLAGKPKMEFTTPELDAGVLAEVEKTALNDLKSAITTQDKMERYRKLDELKAKTVEALVPESLVESDPEAAAAKKDTVKEAFGELKYNTMRKMIVNEKQRIDGRSMTQIRPIAVETGILPSTHGSALFTRGETQVLAAVTLGTKDDQQIIDTIHENSRKTFMLHYNFPPYCVGETGRFGGQGRREIGHGALAERSVACLAPSDEDFPYTIRIVCETLESNGSSSMGSICAASMALMHAGVPYEKPIAGIAMGLIKEGEEIAILSDILGDEDHLGDMDFKVAGTADGLTGIQMDIKIEGVSREIMEQALTQAKEGRLHILSEMAKGIEKANDDVAPHAPRIKSLMVPTEKIGTIVGPGGKMIKEIIAQTGCSVDIDDTGKVNIASNDKAAIEKAAEWIEGLVTEAEVGKTYKGKVKRIVDFGAFVGILPNQDGLLHISEIAYERVETVEDFFKEGDEVEVKVLDIDRMGKVRLSRKALLEPPEGYVPPPPRPERTGRDGGGRGRDGGRGRRDGGRGGRDGGGRGGRGQTRH